MPCSFARADWRGVLACFALAASLEDEGGGGGAAARFLDWGGFWSVSERCQRVMSVLQERGKSVVGERQGKTYHFFSRSGGWWVGE